MMSADPILATPTPLRAGFVDRLASPAPAGGVEGFGSPQVVPSPWRQWDVAGEAEMPVADPWYEGKKQEIVDAVYARARELRLDISQNPRDLLDHPELVDVLFPGGISS